MTALQESALIWLAAIVLLLLGLSGYVTSTSTASAKMVEAGGVSDLPVDLTAEVVQILYTKGEIEVVDVREPWEYGAGHIPGARLIPLDDLPTRLDAVPREACVVVVCERGIRSSSAQRLMANVGFDDVHNMVDGMEAWRQRGYDQVTGM